jgi:hypothetical protein
MRKKRFCFVPHGGRKTHAGYEATRDAAMVASAKSRRRE